MESFHPFAVKWFKDHRPEIIRRQLSTNYFKDKINRKWYENFTVKSHAEFSYKTGFHCV